jgi:hypothetical protein
MSRAIFFGERVLLLSDVDLGQPVTVGEQHARRPRHADLRIAASALQGEGSLLRMVKPPER